MSYSRHEAGLHPLRSGFLLLATAIGFGVSFVMMRRLVGADSPWLGLILMFYFLGLAKMAEPLFMLRLPRMFRAIRPWEGRSYRRLGIAKFGELLRRTPLRYLNPAVYLARRQPDLLKVYRFAESAEAAHFWAAALFTPYIAFVWLSGHAREAAIFLIVQLVFNVYPILHLRVARGRLDRPLERWRARHLQGAA